jgi:hypothetical protein
MVRKSALFAALLFFCAQAAIVNAAPKVVAAPTKAASTTAAPAPVASTAPVTPAPVAAPVAPPAGPAAECGACITYVQLIGKALGPSSATATKDQVGRAMCDQTVLNAYEGCVKCSPETPNPVPGVTTAADLITQCASYNSKLTQPSDTFPTYNPVAGAAVAGSSGAAGTSASGAAAPASSGAKVVASLASLALSAVVAVAMLA